MLAAKGSGSRSSPIELSDDEDMRAPVPKAQTLAVKPGRNNATRQTSPATRSKSAKRKREEEQPDAFVPRPPPKATAQAPAPVQSQPKQKNKKKGSNKQQQSSKQTQPPSKSSQPVSKPTRTGHPQQAGSHSDLALPPHMAPPHMSAPLMSQGEFFDAPLQSGWVNAMFSAAEGPSNPPIHHTLPQKPDIEMHDPMPSTSYIPPTAPALSQRPVPSLQSSPPVTQARAKAPATAPTAKKQKGRSMTIGYEPDPDPKAAHGCVPSEALAPLAPWTPDPERTLVMENIPKAYRNHPEWVSKWALSVCGVAPPIVVTNKVLRDKAIIEFPSNALASSAWRSKRLNPELDKLPPDQLKGQPRLDFIRVYWLVVDGESPGYNLAQKRQQEAKGQMPASEGGESSTSSAPAPKLSKKQKQKQKADAQHQQQPPQPPPSLDPYTDAALAQLPSLPRRPSLSLTSYTDAALAAKHGQPVPHLSYTPYADAFLLRRAQAAAEGRDVWDDDLYAQALASLPSLSTPILPPPPPPNGHSASDRASRSQASRPSQRQPPPTQLPLRSPSPFAIGPPIDIDMNAIQRRASSSSADCVMISPPRSAAASSPVRSHAAYSPIRSNAPYSPIRSEAACASADPIVIDVDEGEYEVDGRMQSLEPGEIRMDYVLPAPAKAPSLSTPQKPAPLATSKPTPVTASKPGPSKGAHVREPAPTASSSGKSTTTSSGRSTAAPSGKPSAAPSNAAITPERMAVVQDKVEGITQDKSEGVTRLEDELKALVRQSRRTAQRAAPSHSAGPSSSQPTRPSSFHSARPPSPPPPSSTSTAPQPVSMSITSQSTQVSQTASSVSGHQTASATGLQSAAATVEDDAEMFIKMAISEASAQPPSTGPASAASALQPSMPMAIEQKTEVLQTSSRTQLSQSWPPHAISWSSPASTRPPPSTDLERRLDSHLNESKRLLAMLSAAKTKDERERIVVLIKEMNRRYAPAGAAAASSTQQHTAGQTSKPRRKWPAPEQGPVIIEISDDEYEYDEAS